MSGQYIRPEVTYTAEVKYNDASFSKSLFNIRTSDHLARLKFLWLCNHHAIYSVIGDKVTIMFCSSKAYGVGRKGGLNKQLMSFEDLHILWIYVLGCIRQGHLVNKCFEFK